jgi:hypothetical protein
MRILCGMTKDQKIDLVMELGKKIGYEGPLVDRQEIERRYAKLASQFDYPWADDALDKTIEGWEKRLKVIQQQAVAAARYALLPRTSIPTGRNTLKKAILRGEYDQYSLPEVEAVKKCCA